jgi:hypothetical protein
MYVLAFDRDWTVDVNPTHGTNNIMMNQSV